LPTEDFLDSGSIEFTLQSGFHSNDSALASIRLSDASNGRMSIGDFAFSRKYSLLVYCFKSHFGAVDKIGGQAENIDILSEPFFIDKSGCGSAW
jgi:hypothetical protein